MTTNKKPRPCTKCGGKLRPVKSRDSVVNALFCDDCRTLHMFNVECGSAEATIERYNNRFDEQTGANNAY